MSDELDKTENTQVTPKRSFVERIRTAPAGFWGILACAVVILVLSLILINWDVALTLKVDSMSFGFFIVFFGKMFASLYPLLIILSVLGAFGTLYMKSAFNKAVIVTQIITICVLAVSVLTLFNT